MTARGRRFLARLVTTLVAGLAGILTVGALPAAAETDGIGQYVALGDSFAAGQGASAPGDYLNNCLQSPNGYPALLDAENQIHLRANAACTGATTSDLAEKQLSALKQGTRLVTLTAGAADLNLSGVLAACTAGTSEQCDRAITSAVDLLSVSCGGTSESEELLNNLTDLYAGVAKAAPDALIVVTGYPFLFELVQGDPDLALKTQINNATAALNCTIKKAVAEAEAAGINIVYVDVTEAFAGHGIGGSEEPFINPPGTGINAFHPTAAGYVAYAEAISAVLPSSSEVNQEQVA